MLNLFESTRGIRRSHVYMVFALVFVAFLTYNLSVTRRFIQVFSPTIKEVTNINDGSGNSILNDTSRSQIPPLADRENLVKARFTQRKNRVQALCSTKEYQKPDPRKFYNSERVESIFFGRLQWCRIAKIGTTFIKSIRNEKSLEKWLQKQPRTFEPQKYNGNQKRIFFVRDPYSRLVSGYVDKIVLTPEWMKTMGLQVNKFVGNATSVNASQCGAHVTFPQFVKYFIHSELTNSGRDFHFIPIHDQCNFCNESVDFMGHLETFSEDLDYILRSVGIVDFDIKAPANIWLSKIGSFYADKNYIEKCIGIRAFQKRLWISWQMRGVISRKIKFPQKASSEIVSPEEFKEMGLRAANQSKGSFDKKKQKDEMFSELFLKVPLEDRLKLRDIYSKDFELFGYEPLPELIFPELYREVE